MTEAIDNMDLFGGMEGYEPAGASNDASVSQEPENAAAADSVAVIANPKRKTKAAIKDELAHELRKLEAGNQDEVEAPDYATLDMAVAMEHRPRYVVRDEWTKTYGRPGVWFHGLKIGVESIVPIDTFICTPLHVLAITRDDGGRNFGRLLNLKDTLGRWKEWAMPMSILAGDGIELRAMLLDMGAEPDPDAKSSLLRYIQKQHPKRQVLAATKLGWHGGGYLMTDRYFAPANDEIDAVLQDGVLHSSGLFERRGALAAWSDGVARYAPGNPLLTLTLSSAFAAPLLKPCHIANGGFHINGETSTGKTTVNNAAASVWGNPEKGKQVKTWRATGNGLEGAAAMANDNLLVLDEIGELSDPKELGNVIYFLGNGSGKTRAARAGSMRAPAMFRLLFLSNGELDKRAVFDAAKMKAQAGMDVRMVELPANRQHGAFDNLHGLSSGAALSNAINDACFKLFGTAGPAFLQNLIDDASLDAPAMHKAIVDSFDAEPGAQQRVASLFALVALGGELATSYGITGWQSGMAIDAAKLLFNEWRKHRPSGNQEAPAMLEAVRDFIDRHGGARFENRDHDDGNNIIRDRAGWFEDTDKGRVYLFTNGGMKEALAGFDLRRGLDVLDAAGWLTGRDKANPAWGKQIKIHGANHRVFSVFLSDMAKSPVTAVTYVTANENSNLLGNVAPLPPVTAVTNPTKPNSAPAKGNGGNVSNGKPVTDNILVNQCGNGVTAVTGEKPDTGQNHDSDLAADEPDFEVF